jgi:arylsulfatase A-like enzyme
LSGPGSTRRLARGAALLCAGLAACGRTDAEPARSLVLLTLDTTRADALSCYGGEPGRTPVLDRIAAEGVLYERAHTVMPTTQPAHASLMTGLYPVRHGVRDTGIAPLTQAASTLAERARAAGLQTAAFVAHTVLDPSFGLDQGFEHYRAPSPPPPGRQYSERGAREIVDEALAWLAARERARPFLLWAHFYDPHFPYRPPGPDGRDSTGEPQPEGEDDPLARRDYEAEVAAMDREIGRLLDALRGEGALEHTTLLVVGDHGEAFGEHGETMHGLLVTQATLRVPLILRPPDGLAQARRARRSTETVSLVDVYPTALEALGLAPEPGLDGISLWNAEVQAGRGVYFESYSGWAIYGWSPIWGWLDERGKLVQDDRPRLYDLARDPGEERDRAAEEPGEVRRRQLEIRRLADAPRLATGGGEIGEDVLDALRGLGYLQATGAASEWPDLLASDGRTVPEQRAELLRLMQRATRVFAQGSPERAAHLLDKVLDQDPGNYWALEHLALCQRQLGHPERAARTLERLLAIGPQRSSWWHGLGLNRKDLGQRTQAIEAFERAVELSTGRTRASELRELIPLLQAEGRTEEAGRRETELRELESGSGAGA